MWGGGWVGADMKSIFYLFINLFYQGVAIWLTSCFSSSCGSLVIGVVCLLSTRIVGFQAALVPARDIVSGVRPSTLNR